MMHLFWQWPLRAGACLTGAALVAGAAVLTPAASAAPRAPGAVPAARSGPVSPDPASGTPSLVPNGRSNETVRQLVECGGIMYVVGKFSEVSWNGKTYARNNAFRFKATAPYTMSGWNPNVNGEVNSVALSSKCSDAYLGGQFSSVGGTSANNLAEVSTSTGAVNQGFGHSASAIVYSVLLTPKGHLLVGGNFKIINNSKADPYYTSLNPTTGKNDGYLSLAVSGHYVYAGVAPNATGIFNQQLSPNGSEVLAEGDFTSVQGRARQQIFMLSLGASKGSVTSWYSKDFNQFCGDHHPLYVKSAAWSPDGSTVYTADTGKFPLNWNHAFPLKAPNLCDVVVAFPATHSGVLSPRWTNYSGCYSFFSVAADSFAVYAGGHERWADNQNACKSKGSGAIPASGMGGFTPSTGALIRDSSGTKGRYSMSRANADDMLVTKAGLWIGSSDRFNAANCGNAGGHTGICFLPYAG